jgi:DNA replication protein DnaC
VKPVQSITTRVRALEKQIRKSQGNVKDQAVSMAAKTYECDLCKDECVIIDQERNTATVCTCVAQKRIERVLRHSRISEEFRSKTFASFDIDGKDERIVKAYKMAKQYAIRFDDILKTEKNGFGIVGASGVGKTHLLCAIANDLLSSGIGVRYFNFVTGFKEMFAKYDDGGQAVEDIRFALMSCDVLMIDDIAKGKLDRKTGHVEIGKGVYDEMYAIVDYRYENRLPIIWSSELYSKLVSEDILGEATATRLFEKSTVATILYGKDEPVGMLNYRIRHLVEQKNKNETY